MFLNGYMLVELLDFIRNNQMQEPKLLDTDICIVNHAIPFEYNGGALPPGLYAYLTKYPDEGLFGPLGECLDNTRSVQLNSSRLLSFEQLEEITGVLQAIAGGQSQDPAHDASVLLELLHGLQPTATSANSSNFDLEVN